MSISNKDLQILSHMLRHCERIEQTVIRSGSFVAVASDADYLDAVCLNILQIGELAGRLSEEFIRSFQDAMPWKEMRAMRNVVAHDYLSLDIDRLWDTAQDDIPLLKAFCEQQLNNT